MPIPHNREKIPSSDRGEVPPYKEKVLSPDEQVQIDLALPLADCREMYDKTGIYGNLVAAVDAGHKNFMIVDTRSLQNNRAFVIIDDTFSVDSPKQQIGLKGVREDDQVVIGRGHYADRFNYPGTVSRDHFAVTYTNNELCIRNLHPTNTTTLTAHMVNEQDPRSGNMRYVVKAIRTNRVEDRMLHTPNFSEKDDAALYGRYYGHPILGRKSRSVKGGVYLGSSAREAIVVDDTSVAMQKAYDSIVSNVRQPHARQETLSVDDILTKVMHGVKEVMPYDHFKTQSISSRYAQDKLVGLSTYLEGQAGVCRHQALMAAYILENLIQDGYLSGSVGVERNTIEDLGGTHAWAIYRAENASQYEGIVVDPAQSFVGTKDYARREGRWEYYLGDEE